MGHSRTISAMRYLEVITFFSQTGQLVELSAQQIVDCSWGSGNHGCRGGWYNKALSWIYMNGVAKAKNYGPYLAQVGHDGASSFETREPRKCKNKNKKNLLPN